MILIELYSFFVQTLISSLVVSFMLIIWNETNAFAEYLKLFGFNLDDYKGQEEVGVLYVDYLASKYPNSFIVKLLACPICLATWLSIFSSLLYKNVYITFSTFYISLLMYFLFKLLMNKSDE
jgi:hypothetical protein